MLTSGRNLHLYHGTNNLRLFSPTPFTRLSHGSSSAAAANFHKLESEVMTRQTSVHKIESQFNGDHNSAIKLRRKFYESELSGTNTIPKHTQKHKKEDGITQIPYKNYDHSKVFGVCCENVIGYVPIPLGIAGPLRIDGRPSPYHIPLATTEGALVASVNRGCKAIMASNPGVGVRTSVQPSGMSRAPVVELESAESAGKLCNWLRSKEGFETISGHFGATSGHLRLTGVSPFAAGRTVYIRLSAQTGDAMGMNMISIATEHAMKELQHKFGNLKILSLSSNFCSDKKPAAINFMLGRGHSVCAEAAISGKALKKILGTNGKALERLTLRKCWLGSALAGAAPGGLNAHAANIVTAIFLATGQDLAQVVESSNCVTSVERIDDIDAPEYRKDDRFKGGVLVSCTMPSLEVGTVGGGTRLKPQESCLGVMGIEGPSEKMGRVAGYNSATLAKVICSTVLAGELSLLAALTSKKIYIYAYI